MKWSEKQYQVKIKRYIITGPECSGKTTLAAALAKKLETGFVPEIARDYLAKHPNSYTLEDVLKMAKLQYDAIKSTPASEIGLQICDTAMLEFKIWLDDKFYYTDPFTEQAFENLKDSFYFLCKPDIPFEKDPLREDPHRRMELFERYLAVLNDKKMLFKIIEGTLENRLDTAIDLIKSQKLI